MSVELTPGQLRAVQLTELSMLLEVDRICRKRNIRYNIIAGTFLGAVRHGGFIPWDDDADVAMLRAEYEKFREAVRTDLDTERFYFQDIEETEGYRWGYGKLRRKETLFLREYQEHFPYEQGIFIDIFPLDAVPDSLLLRRMTDLECYIVRKILWSKAGMRAEKDPLKRGIYRVLAKIPEKGIKQYYGKMVRRAEKRDSDWVRILTFPAPNRMCGYLRRWYEDSREISFEGHLLQGIRDYDGYLRFKFGNYRKLPPREMRKTHPVSRLRVPEIDSGNDSSKTP